MKIVRVTYTTKAEYADQNQKNIQKVMSDLQAINNPGINYHCCLSPDGKTFTHLAFMKSEDEQKVLNDLASFQDFQTQLRASGLESPPKQELLSLVGNSTEIFKG